MTESFSADCPVCGQRVVVTGMTASCGRCGIATSASDARKSWPNVATLDSPEAGR